MTNKPTPASQPTPAQMICPQCGVDRFKLPCPGMASDCAMIADAHLIAAEQQREASTEPSAALREALYRLRNECDLSGLRDQAGFDCWLREADKALARAGALPDEATQEELGKRVAANRNAARYKHIRDTANNGYELRGTAGIGKWHVSRKVREGEGEYLFGDALDKAIDASIAAHTRAGSGK